MAQRYSVQIEHAGKRADVFLAAVSPYTRSHIGVLMQQGHIRSEGEPLQAKDKVRAGQNIDVNIPEVQQVPIAAQELPLDIVYQDDCIAVINKPRGLVVHPGAGVADKTMVNALLYHLDNLSGINGELRPGIVHRLDKDTTGLLLVAKNDMAHQSLSTQIQSREVKREYIALVHGNIQEDSGTIDAPIGRHPKERKKMAVIHNGRQARTHFDVIRRYGDMTLVRLSLDTGRTHQIRVHLAHLQHPVVFDPVYGIKRDKEAKRGQLLHAFRISFNHPKTGERMIFCASLPEDFLAVLRQKGEIPELF